MDAFDAAKKLWKRFVSTTDIFCAFTGFENTAFKIGEMLFFYFMTLETGMPDMIQFLQFLF